MKTSIKTIGLTLAGLLSASAFAEGLRLGPPGYGGSGCPAGSASVTLSPDQSTLSIIFDKYSVEAGGTTGKTIDRKSCDLAIPVQVPNGYSVAVFDVDYRGFNALPLGGRSQFNVEYFFAGSQGLRYQKTFRGLLADNYLLTNTLQAESLVWSPCGAQVTLRSNSSMMVMTNGRREQAMSTVDSADIRSGIVYHLQFRQCR